MTVIRRPGAASAAVLIGLSACLVAAHAIAPDWSRRAGLDVWNLAAAEEAGRDAVEQRAEIEANGERAARRRETANHTAAQLAAGTITLPAAADEIRAIFADDKGMALTLATTYHAVPTDRLRFARHTIERATRLLLDDPTRLEDVSARLEAEYCAMAAAEAPEMP